jgi:hypothetical protein
LPGAGLDENQISRFLEDWSERRYTDEYEINPKRAARKVVEKRFGLSRASTLLHFISGGRFPIFDSRVRRAMSRLLDCPVRNTIRWYLDSYCPLFSKLARECGTDDLRLVDMALFCYGERNGIGDPISASSNASLTEPAGPIYGIVRGLGQKYASGMERLEIHVNKDKAQELKYVEGLRIETYLIIGSETYGAGIRSTRTNRYVWICPDLVESTCEKVSLAVALARNKIGKNQKLLLQLDSGALRISPAILLSAARMPSTKKKAPFGNLTTADVAPSITWKLVTILPSLLTTTPLPCLISLPLLSEATIRTMALAASREIAGMSFLTS